MITVRSRNHLGMDITTQTQFHTNVLPLDDLTILLFDVDDVTESVGVPRKQRLQLKVRSGYFRFGKMQSHLQARSLCAHECVCEDADVTLCWITAEIDAYDAR